MGKRGLLIASVNIDADKEKKFNQFYNEKHLDVSLRIPDQEKSRKASVGGAA